MSDSGVWLAVLETRFDAVWRWAIGFALLSSLALLLRGLLRQQMLLLSGLLQLMALAGTGHAAMHDGWLGALQQGNHTLQSIDTILSDDKAHPGQKMNLQPIIDRAQLLCGKSFLTFYGAAHTFAAAPALL